MVDTAPMRTINILPSISRLAGGLAPAVLNSVCVQRRLGVDAHITTLQDAYTAEDAPGSGIPYEAVPSFTPFGYSPQLREMLLQPSPPDLVHAHGMWMYGDLLALQLSRSRGIPLITSPHGMLKPQAFYHHWWKKLPIWWCWERQKHARAAALVASSASEAEDIRAYGLATPIAVIPHGLSLPPLTCEKPQNNPRIALFLSRLHPIKGLPLLVAAVARLRPHGWTFIIAGPDQAGYEGEIRRTIHAEGLDTQFAFPGALYGEEKAFWYRTADLFVLPTLSENFGIVIAEALAYETPVLTTTGAPWPDLVSQQCGWWVDPSVEGFTQGLAVALETPTAKLREMGQRGRKLVQANYSWERATQELLVLYEWVIGRRARPTCVING